MILLLRSTMLDGMVLNNEGIAVESCKGEDVMVM